MKLLEECLHLIGLDSSPVVGTGEVGDSVAKLAQRLGFEVELFPEVLNGVKHTSVVCHLPGSSHEDEPLLLVSRLDTRLPGAYRAWTKTGGNPFNGSVEGDRLYGLGAAEQKLNILYQLQALSAFKEANLQRPVVLVATYGQDAATTGLTRLWRRKKWDPKLAIVAAPTGKALGLSGFGLAVVEITIPFSPTEKVLREKHDLGESSSTQSKVFQVPYQSDFSLEADKNALIKLLHYLEKAPRSLLILDIEGGRSSCHMPEHAFLEFDLAGEIEDISIGQRLLAIYHRLSRFKEPEDAGIAFNLGRILTLSESIRVEGCCRLSPDVGDVNYRRWLRYVKEACQDEGALCRLIHYFPAFAEDVEGAESQICFEALSKAALPAKVTSVPSCPEASLLARWGIPTYVFGPSNFSLFGQAENEWVSIEDLESTVVFYKALIERFCQ